MSEMELRPALTWKPDGGDIVTITSTNIAESFDNRIVERNRPYREAAKLDDTGRGSIVWTVTTEMFDATISQEPGVPANQFTEVEAKLFLSFQSHKTGYLSLPTRGIVRAKAKSWSRGDDIGERDCALLRLTWIEDNEDDVDFYAFDQFSARATVVTLAEETTKDLVKAGIADKDVFSLSKLAAKLESIAQKPGEYLQDLEVAAAQLGSAADRIEQAYTVYGSTPGSVDALLSDPGSAPVIRNLRNLKDTARKAYYQASSGQPPIKTVKYAREMSFATIATDTGNTTANVLKLNTKLLDPFSIPPNTPIKVYEVG